MSFWTQHMPTGMKLKSEGFASSLYDPASAFTLDVYCKEKGIPYKDIGLPVPLKVFSDYGLEFQRRMVPNLERKMVTSVKQVPDGFELRLDNGETVAARRVVVATGLTHFNFIPPAIADLPKQYVTHSADHTDLDEFRGRDVVVVGRGASALDIAGLLHEIGARVQVVVRESKVRFHDPPPPTPPTFFDRLREPITGIGPGWKLWLCCNLPLVFRHMSKDFRFEKVRTVLGPAPGWFVREQIIGKVPLTLNTVITEAKVQDGKVHLQLKDRDGKQSQMVCDHVISGTGYKTDVRKLPFLDPSIVSRINHEEQIPILSSYFETSVPGLFIVGVTAAQNFGPVLRFAYGAGFASKRVSRYLDQTAKIRVAPGASSAAPAQKAKDPELAVR
jgi:thioredoxin reductase